VLASTRLGGKARKNRFNARRRATLNRGHIPLSALSFFYPLARMQVPEYDSVLVAEFLAAALFFRLMFRVLQEKFAPPRQAPELCAVLSIADAKLRSLSCWIQVLRFTEDRPFGPHPLRG